MGSSLFKIQSPPLMALFFHPRPFLASIPAKTVFCAPHKPSFRLSASAARVESDATTTAGTAILWYKHDLRIEDHPGLIAASQHRCVVPLYVFDHRILSRFSDEMLEILLFALEDLRKLLKEKGSDLMIRFGTAENVISNLVREVQASSLYVEEEVEYELCAMLDTVKKSLSDIYIKEENPIIVMWRSPFYDIKSLSDLPSSFDDFQKLKLPVVSGLEPPKLLANLMDLSWGPLPVLSDLKKYMDVIPNGGNTKKEWASMLKVTAENMLQKKERGNLEAKSAELENGNVVDFVSNTNERNKSKKSAFVTSQGNLVGGGSSLVLIALAAYLRYLEGTARYEFQEVHTKLRLAEKREGSSFQALFGSVLLLGIISRRRVYFETIKYEKERNGGFLSPFGYSTTTVAAAISCVSSIEWFWLLALKSQRNKADKFSFRIWRWHNYIIQYTVAGDKGPAILLVHGFGAFLEHYRDNLHPIAKDGNRVWAVTLIGFGKSEKPNIIYTELLWAELLRDFIIEVVKEPVHLVGNSIGGYTAAIVAGLWPSLAKSIVLINSAGNIVPGYSHLGYSKSEDRRISGSAWLGARLLLFYLRLNIRNTLRTFYPTETDRADVWLMNEMIRASDDPGATFVMESIFTFDLSLPLNYLLEEFDKKILVIQGMKDPLVDSRSKLALFREHCRGVAIKEIDAGHCPHDELPDEVNSVITKWVATLEREASHATRP